MESLPSWIATLLFPQNPTSRQARVANPEYPPTSPTTLVEVLERSAGRRERFVGFLDNPKEQDALTFSDVLEGARTHAVYLRNRGLQRGERVLLILPTSQAFLFALLGTQLAGGVPVPLALPNAFGSGGRFLEALWPVLQNACARFLVAHPSLESFLLSQPASSAPAVEVIFSDRVSRESPSRPLAPSIDGDDPALLQYTSGTTGTPKGVVVTHRNILSNCYGIGRGFRVVPDDVGVGWLPLYHDMGLIGLLLTALYWQRPVYLMKPETFLMRPMQWLESIMRHKASISPAPNFAYHYCLERIPNEEIRRLDLRSWRVALNGAEPVDIGTATRFVNRFAPAGFDAKAMLPVYGLAENCLAATFPRLDRPLEVVRLDRRRLLEEGVASPVGNGGEPYTSVSVGYPLAGQTVAISNGSGGYLTEGRVGEILLRGPCVTKGYFRQDEETARILKNGWLHTGDLGFILDGRLFVVSRLKELVIKRGRNYYPQDIERCATVVPGVRKGRVAAFSVPDTNRGTECLVVVAETRETETRRRSRMVQAIRAEVLARVGVLCDRVVLTAPGTIPKTSSGKVRRLACKRLYQEGVVVPDARSRRPGDGGRSTGSTPDSRGGR